MWRGGAACRGVASRTAESRRRRRGGQWVQDGGHHVSASFSPGLGAAIGGGSNLGVEEWRHLRMSRCTRSNGAIRVGQGRMWCSGAGWHVGAGPRGRPSRDGNLTRGFGLPAGTRPDGYGSGYVF
jgi:hypothetical protein